MKFRGFIAVFAFILLSIYFWGQGDIQPSSTNLSINTDLSPKHKPVKPTTVLDTFSAEEQRNAFSKSSLADTDIDRTTLSLINGELSLKPEILFYFEYFLNLRGEKSLATIKKMAATDFKQHYKAAIADQLYDLFLRYIAYRHALGEVFEQQDFSDIPVEHRMQSVEKRVQPLFFSAREIEGLFQAQQRILNRVSKAESQQGKFLHYQQIIQNAPHKAEAAATKIFGAEAAQRLQHLQQQETRWQTQLVDYRLQRDAINASEGLDNFGKEEAIDLLQKRLFDKRERLRVQALQRNNLLP